jgi:hypothetical protein
LASLSGHGEAVKPKNNSAKSSAKTSSVKPKDKSTKKIVDAPPKSHSASTVVEAKSNLGLTVRIEINLPAQGDQDTYDRIFQSIKRNLIDG